MLVGEAEPARLSIAAGCTAIHGLECLACDLAAVQSKIGASVLTPSTIDTGIATTPPGTDSSGSSATGDEDGAVVEVTYAFVAELAGVPLDCVSADASLVDVYVVASDDPERAMWDLQDLPCDDTAIEVGPLPPGAYELQVVAWSPALWEGSSGVIDLGLDASTVSIDLVEVPKR